MPFDAASSRTSVLQQLHLDLPGLVVELNKVNLAITGGTDVNRFFKRMQHFRKRYSARRSQGLMANTEDKLHARGTPPDTASVRAKSQAHGKVTADKWNQ
jgi:hypothetical protein